MRNMAKDAGYMALEEVQNGRTAMILFPTSSWGAVMFDMGCVPEGIFLRVSNRHSNLKSIVLDTLILVAADDDGWDQEGLALVKERLRGCANPKLISIFRELDRDDETLEGGEIWTTA